LRGAFLACDQLRSAAWAVFAAAPPRVGAEDARIVSAKRGRVRCCHHAWLKAIFAQTTGGIALTDLDGRFVTVNQRYCEIVGYSVSGVLNLQVLPRSRR
jgi:PAS domain-containing protein